MTQYHPFHLVNPSPWPIVGSMAVFSMMTGGVMYFHRYVLGEQLLFLGLALVIATMVVWWRDVIREATYQGHHTLAVQKGLKLGVVLFILSEVLFFVSFL